MVNKNDKNKDVIYFHFQEKFDKVPNQRIPAEVMSHDTDSVEFGGLRIG